MANVPHTCFNLGSVLPGFFLCADLLGQGIALALKGLLFGFVASPDFITFKEFADKLMRVSPATADALRDVFRVFADALDVEHGGRR